MALSFLIVGLPGSQGLGISIWPWQFISLSGSIIPSFKAAEAIKGLIVDPVRYLPEIARLKRGLSFWESFKRACKAFSSAPFWNRLLSKLGKETKESTPPFLGSKA